MIDTPRVQYITSAAPTITPARSESERLTRNRIFALAIRLGYRNHAAADLSRRCGAFGHWLSLRYPPRPAGAS